MRAHGLAIDLRQLHVGQAAFGLTQVNLSATPGLKQISVLIEEDTDIGDPTSVNGHAIRRCA
jgi:hypothetical protein